MKLKGSVKREGVRGIICRRRILREKRVVYLGRVSRKVAGGGCGRGSVSS